MSVTACLITRNHGRSIEQTVRSVRGLATEVVMADTGSTDRTVAVAEGLGARVVSIEWADDFSAACDAAIGHPGRWDEAKACFGGLLNDPAHRERAAQGFALADRRERPAG